LDPVATLFCNAIFSALRTLREIPLKLGPDAIPRSKLVFCHAVRLRIASISRGALERRAAADYNQRNIRVPLNPLPWFHGPSRPGHGLVWGRSCWIEFVQAERLFLMSGVQEDQTCYFMPVASLKAPDIDSRIGMTHQHKWALFARGLQPCVQIVNYF